MELSSEARVRVTELDGEYHRNLLATAADIACRARADCISQADLDAADAAIRTARTSTSAQFWAEIGAGLFGAGLSQFITVISSSTTIETIDFAFSFVSAVVGVGMLLYFRRR